MLRKLTKGIGDTLTAIIFFYVVYSTLREPSREAEMIRWEAERMSKRVKQQGLDVQFMRGEITFQEFEQKSAGLWGVKQP